MLNTFLLVKHIKLSTLDQLKSDRMKGDGGDNMKGFGTNVVDGIMEDVETEFHGVPHELKDVGIEMHGVGDDVEDVRIEMDEEGASVFVRVVSQEWRVNKVLM